MNILVLALGAYLYGALYLIGVFVAALTLTDQTALFLSIFSAGASYVAQIVFAFAEGRHVPAFITNAVWAVAAISGAAAGISLIGG